MGVRKEWTYELVDGTKGSIKSLPIDFMLAEKRKLNPNTEAIAFTSFVLHSALLRQAKKNGEVMNAWEVWREHDLVDFDVVGEDGDSIEEGVGDIPFMNGQQHTESVF